MARATELNTSMRQPVHIIDESGEDYLYPASFFCMVELPQTVERALRRSLPLAV